MNQIKTILKRDLLPLALASYNSKAFEVEVLAYVSGLRQKNPRQALGLTRSEVLTLALEVWQEAQASQKEAA